MLKKSGFTLAEVLITLGIIGVVAAMTIPTLMNSTNGAEFKSGFKKIISTLNQAVTMSVAVDNLDFSSLAPGDSTTSNTIAFMLNNKMNVASITNAADANLDAGANASVLLGSTDNYTVFFNDGMVFSYPKVAGTGNCGTASSTWCAGIVDVNGARKPNNLTNCATSASAAKDSGTCTAANATIKDRFSIKFAGQEVVPNGPGARYFLYN